MTPMPTGRHLVVETPAPFVAFALWEPRPRELMNGSRAVIKFALESVQAAGGELSPPTYLSEGFLPAAQPVV
jgi:hypothetical protein